MAEHLQASWAQRQRTVGHWLQVVRAGGEPRARLAVAACEGWPGSIAWQRKQACLSEVERSAGAVSVRFRDPGDDPLVKTFAHGLTLEVQGVEVGGSLRVHVDLRRRALEAGQERVRTPWGELTRPVEGWSWRVEESVRQGRGPALAGEVRAPGAPTLQVRLDSRMEGSK